MLSSNNFLNNVLHIIFPNENIEITNSRHSHIYFGFSPSELKLLPSLVGMSILDNLEDNDDFMQGFILGMKDANANIKPRFNDQSAGDYDKLKVLITAQNDYIKQADLYFSKLRRT